MTHRLNGENGHSSHPPRKRRDRDLSDRLPPQNLEAERSVIGACLLDNEVLHEVVAILKVEDFYRDNHQILYRAIRDLYDLGGPIDALMLADELTRRGEFEQVGGDIALSDLLASVPHSANAVFHAQIVAQKAQVRALIEAANTILRDGYSNSFTADDLIERAERDILAVSEGRLGKETCEAYRAADLVFERLAERKRGASGLRTGWGELDRMTDGLQPEQLIIVGARPTIGKTVIGLNVASFAAIDLAVPVLFVSLEMNRIELGERLLISRSGIPAYKFKDPEQYLGAPEQRLLAEAYAGVRGATLEIDDAPTRDVSRIAALARRFKARKGLSLLVVDYLQLIAPGSDAENRQEQVSEISKGLKRIARELAVPVLCLCQLNRKVEERADKRPIMADLRESGAIEQDADLVLLLHRPEYYDANERPGEMDILIAKNRNGPTGSVKLAFQKDLCRAVEPAAADRDPPAGAF